MSEIFDGFVPSLLDFFAYFGVSAGLTILFVFVYWKTTKHNEIALIKEDSISAASAFAGA